MKRRSFVSAIISFILPIMLFTACDMNTVIDAVGGALDDTHSYSAEKEVLSDTAGNEMFVHYLDVGQADSIVVELPDDKLMLIDAGVKDSGQTIVTYIHSLGYDYIDYFVCTHAHADHIGGAVEVIENFEIGTVVVSPEGNTTYTYESTMDAINQSGAELKYGMAGYVIASGDNYKAEVIAPATQFEDFTELNNSSVVIKLTYGTRVFLFMADAEELEESTITANIRCDVLKVGHHGSTSSTSLKFLNKALPSIAIISCGVNNEYGHPHDMIINRLKGKGATIYRTDEDGTIVIKTDGVSLEVVGR